MGNVGLDSVTLLADMLWSYLQQLKFKANTAKFISE